MKKVIAYRLQPVGEIAPGGLGTAAVMSCMATGETLSGMGGGGLFLSPRVVQALRNEGTSKVVCEAAAYDSLVAMARRAAAGEDVRSEAARIISRETSDDV